MVRCCVVLLLSAAALAAVLVPEAPARTAPDKVESIRLGLLTGMFRDVSPDLIQAASSPFRDLFKRETGLNAEVELVDDCQVLAAKLNDKKVQFGVFHGFEYAWVKEQYPELQPLVVSVPNGGKVQAMLVVHTTCKAQKPEDLKGACVMVPVGTKAHCHLYMDRLQSTLPANTCCPLGPREFGTEEALDAVVNNKCQAALVDIGALTAYQNNKPGAALQLRILHQSEMFPPAVVVYRKDGIDTKVLDKVRTGLVEVKKNPQGRVFLMLWRLQGFSTPPENYDAELQRIQKAYPAPIAMEPPVGNHP